MSDKHITRIEDLEKMSPPYIGNVFYTYGKVAEIFVGWNKLSYMVCLGASGGRFSVIVNHIVAFGGLKGKTVAFKTVMLRDGFTLCMSVPIISVNPHGVYIID